MKCKRCGGVDSWHNWAQKPYCSPFCKRGSTNESSVQGEWTRHAKTDVIGHEADIEQPVRYDGTFNPRFVAAHGTEAIEKNYKVSKRTIEKNVERYG